MRGALAILGPGTLGLSTAQWAAECGLQVKLLGRDRRHALGGFQRLEARWHRAVQEKRLTADACLKAQSRITCSAFEPEAMAGLGAFLEALPEAPGIKIRALAQAKAWGDPGLLLLSGTSALPITELALGADLQHRLVGFHLFVPVPSMAVVETAVPTGTDQVWIDRTRELGLSLHKRVIQVRDQPGFAAARMALAQGLEAMRLLESGVASAEDLDALMTLGYGHPVGPLELSDRVGLDLRLNITEGLVARGETRFKPPAILQRLTQQGQLGRKSGQGFYPWRRA